MLRPNLSSTDVKIPGPGHYNPEAIQLKSKAPIWRYINIKCFRIGTSNRSVSKSLSGNIPGPGNYNYTKEIGSEGPKVVNLLILDYNEN